MQQEPGLETYLSHFKAFAQDGASKSPSWLRAIRDEAMASFRKLGFPTTRQEGWRFTNIAPLTRTSFHAAPTPSEVAVDLRQLRPCIMGEEWSRLVFIDGHYCERLSSIANLPQGVRVGSLLQVLETDAEFVKGHLAKYADYKEQPFIALNTAFLNDGAFLYVPPDVTLPHPVELLFVSTEAETAHVYHPRSLMVFGRMATGAVVESYVSLSEASYFTNAVTELVAGEGALVSYCRIQRESKQAYHMATTQAHQQRDCTIAATVLAFGASLSRHDLNVVLDGPGGHATLNGLYLLDGRQHLDHHTVIDHAKPHCTSHELFNGILDDHARSVFTGTIHVHHNAQKTDAKQTNNNLLLSDTARADSQPQLEIFADDVRCTHGATLGPIDDMALFYLQSRGLTRDQARSTLTYGFASDIVGRISDATMRRKLDALVLSHLRERRAAPAAT